MKPGYAPDPVHDIEERQRVAVGESPATTGTREVVESAKEHARDVGGEVIERGRNLAGHVGERLSGEARSQSDRLATGLQKVADDLDEMSDGTSSVAATVIQQLSASSRRAASYLEHHGPEGLFREVQEFARRRPGAFLLGAAAAGFVAGRFGKGLLQSPSSASTGTSRMTGVGITPAGDIRPTATGITPVPSSSSTAVPVNSERSGGRA